MYNQPTRTADTDSRLGQPTRTADTDSRSERSTRTALLFVAALVSLVLVACRGPEPEFQRADLTEEAEAALPDAERDSAPGREALVAAGLEATLSEGPPPPPFVPDEAHYPPVYAGTNFEVALGQGTPRLVEALRVEHGEAESVVTVREEGGEDLAVVLPHGHRCLSLEPGHRYVVITEPRDERGRYNVYLGVGGENSVMLVNDSGAVDTPLGPRDAANLVTEARRSA